MALLKDNEFLEKRSTKMSIENFLQLLMIFN